MKGENNGFKSFKMVRKRSIQIAPYLFIAPNIILFLTFMVIPIFFTFYISFQQWGMFGKPNFIGLDNYSRMFGDKVFWISLRNTVYYTAGTVPFSVKAWFDWCPDVESKVPLRAVFRTIFLPPSSFL